MGKNIRTTAWIKKNCRLASISGTPRGEASHGLVGYSRVYDLAVQWVEQQGKAWSLVPISKTAYVSVFGFKGDEKGKRLSVSWAGKPSDCDVKVEIAEISGDNFGDMRDERAGGRFIIRTDHLHNFPSLNFANTIQGAITELCKKANRGLDPRARWGFALRSLKSMDDGLY